MSTPRVVQPLLITFSLLLAAGVNQIGRADNHTGREEYTIPDHGRLIMDVPTEWQATFYEPQDKSFPVISFYPLDGPKVFQLSVAVFWAEAPLRNLTDPGNLRRFVESVGQEILKQADENTLELEDIVGRSGIGYMFSLSDQDAPEGEYPYLTQGALGVGNVVVVFTLLMQENNTELRKKTLEMLEGARQDDARHDVHLRLRALSRYPFQCHQRRWYD